MRGGEGAVRTVRNLAARVERLERKAPIAKRSLIDDGPVTKWFVANYSDLMKRYFGLLETVGEAEALRQLTDAELEQFDGAFRRAHQVLNLPAPTW